MGDKTARERLKQRVLERWENEGGKTETQPKPATGKNPARGHESEANRSSRSGKNPVGTSGSPRSKRKSR